MRSSPWSLVLAALVAGGCQAQGALVHVFTDATPKIDNISLVTVDTVVNGSSHRTSFRPAAPTSTPVDFGIAFPHDLIGKTANFTVDLFDAANMQLGVATGSTTVPTSTSDLHLSVGGGGSLCPATSPDLGPLCDGFENGRMSFWNAPVTQGTGSKVEIVNSPVKRGSYALHVANGAVSSTDMGDQLVIGTLNETKFVPDHIFVRMFVNVPASFDSTKPGALIILENSTTFAQIEVSINQQGLSVFDTIDGMQYVTTGSTALHADEWHCIELEVQKGNAGGFNLYFDDAQVLVKSGLNTSSAAFNMLAVGLTGTLPGTPARDLYIDEVAVDSSRITCAK